MPSPSMEERIRYYKSELYNYNYCLAELREHDLQLTKIKNDLLGVSAPPTDQPAISSGPPKDRKVALIHTKDKLELKRNSFLVRIETIDADLAKLRTGERELLVDLFIRSRYDPKKTTYEKKSSEMERPDKWLKRHVDKIIKNILENR